MGASFITSMYTNRVHLNLFCHTDLIYSACIYYPPVCFIATEDSVRTCSGSWESKSSILFVSVLNNGFHIEALSSF